MERNRTSLICLVTLTVLAVGVGLFYTRPIMIPFILSVLSYFILSPVVETIQRRLHLRRSLALAFTFGGIVLLFVGVCWFLISTLQVALAGIDSYEESILTLANEALLRLEALGVDTSAISRDQLVSRLSDIPVLSYFGSVAGSALTLLSNAILILIFVGFLLTGRPTGFSQLPLYREVVAETNAYLVAKVFTSTLTAGLTAIILTLLGMNLAVMFGVFAFFLNFIPTIGSIVAALLPLPVAVLQHDSPWFWTTIVFLPGTVQFIIGNILEPKIIGDNLDLHPVTTILVLMFWGLIWGVPGMFLAVPLTVVIRIFLRTSEEGRRVSELMAGRVVAQ